MASLPPHLLLFFLLLILSPPLSHSSLTSFSKTPSKKTITNNNPSSSSPLSPKSSLLRYWSRKIPKSNPNQPPLFFTSKLSPLSPLDSAKFSSLPPSNLSSFCSNAHLACTYSLTSSHSSLSSSSPTQFSVYSDYSDTNFTNYATGGTGFDNSFANYSDGQNIPVDTFRRYSHSAVGDDDKFSFYANDGNVVTSNFTSYSTAATGGSGEFKSYHTDSNVPDLDFFNYDTDANGPDRQFKSYTGNANSGNENFAGYGKRGNGVPTKFASYADNSNVIDSGFSGYGEDANGAFENFTSYGDNGNVPENQFRSYGENGNGGADTFSSYRNQSNVGDESFASYGKKANDEVATFANYGESFNEGSDKFKNYGEGSFDDVFNFTSYSAADTEFKAYDNIKNGNTFSFKSYVNASTVPKESAGDVTTTAKKTKMTSSKQRWVEPGKFFRESSLKKGTAMPMPDIRDRMPSRAFLPRSIASKIPFSADSVRDLLEIRADTAMGKAIGDTVAECGRPPSKGETKHCATSAEDMIDFAVAVLGSEVVVRSTENTNGSKGEISIGEVKGVNGGKVTESVSCHQSLFPYLVYYCHSVPKVRVYEAEILTVDGKDKINHGVAICHIDTSDWGPGHGAFVALGSKPGQIEVCHWIFEGDMTWAIAD